MALEIVTVGADKKALQSFLNVPYRIYDEDPNYVFPLMSEIQHFHDKLKNPFYSHAEAELWLAKRDGIVIGRIGACVDQYNNEHWNEKTGWFGFYEVDDDAEAAAALLKTAQSWIADRGMDIMRGPGCFTSNHDWYGLQVAGEFSRPVIGMPYNTRYYEKQLEDFGLVGAKDLFAWNIVTKGNLPERMERLIKRIISRPGLTIRPFDMKNFFEEASLVRELYNKCWSENWGFIPLDDADFAYMAKDMKSMVDADFLLVAEMDGVPIGFSLTLPDFNQATQPLKGKLLPFGWLKFLWHKRKIHYARTILMGVLPEYRKLGVDMAMVYKTMQAGFAKGISSGECSWILADNKPMNRILEGYGADMYKTYRVYERSVR
ncbi:MAG: GNAT superfamily N-acetyltransferase [Candidatus Krumholzibacteriia bacterium]|jgi:GNAT superfamily N-acetyltransferase